MKTLPTLLFVLLLAGITPAGAQTEPPREAAQPATLPTPAERQQARLAELKTMAIAGEWLELKVGGESVDAIFLNQRTGATQGGVILLPDRACHLDEPGVIHPLRTELPEAGWNTLSVQLMPAEGDKDRIAQLDNAQQRIGAAIAELQRRGINNIVLIGHGFGALAAVDYLAAGDNLAIRGLVIIGMGGEADAEPRLDGANRLVSIRQPIFDLYGMRDYRSVTDSAKRRADIAQARPQEPDTDTLSYRDIARDYSPSKGDRVAFRQLAVAGADHNFSHQSSLLVRHVRGWLERHAPGMETNTNP